jgi:hypothetical protein
MLNEEQIEEVRQFFSSPTAVLIFQQLEQNLATDWMTTSDLAGREQLWQEGQAMARLFAVLRDASAMKKLTQRNQDRRDFQK